MSTDYQQWHNALTKKLADIRKQGQSEAEAVADQQKVLIGQFWNHGKSPEETAIEINYLQWEEQVISLLEEEVNRSDAQAIFDANREQLAVSFKEEKTPEYALSLLNCKG